MSHQKVHPLVLKITFTVYNGCPAPKKSHGLLQFLPRVCPRWYVLFVNAGPASQYHYTSHVDQFMDDLAQFRTTQDALKLLRFPDSQLKQFFQALAAILNLGNIGVGVAHCGGEEVGSIAPGDVWLVKAAQLLEVDKTSLQKWLTHRTIAAVQETITKPLSQKQVS